MTDTLDMDDLLAQSLAEAPFAALVFRPDADLTLVWRNHEHARMSLSEGRAIACLPMFEAFPPSRYSDGSAAVAGIRETVARVIQTGRPAELGPSRFDLPGPTGTYDEHHWQMHFAPIRAEGRIVAILQTARDVTEPVLTTRLAESQRRTSARSASLAYFSYDPETDLFHRHESIDAMFGFAPGEAGAHAAPFFARVHPDDIPAVRAEVTRITAAPAGEIASFDYRVPLPDGRERFLRIRAEMATDPVDRRPKLVGTFVDLTDIEENRRKLARELALREGLVNEANHRISNSLQLALSMLRIEAGQLAREGGPDAERASASLRAVEARVHAVADMHGLMQIDARGATAIDLVAFLHRLAETTRASTELPESALVYEHDDGPVLLDSNRAVATGLIVNELLTNAIKYGRDAAGGTIRLCMDCRPGAAAHIVVENEMRTQTTDGPASSGLGARLVAQFARQIDATVTQCEHAGRFRAEVVLPEDVQETRGA